MKDYTEYDFAAIVGAEVEITTKNGEPVRGTLIDYNFNLAKAPIYIHESGAYVTGVPLAEIKSLTAKIKVEDMSVKQLIRMMDRMKYTNPKFDENGIWFECSNGDKAVARFGKDIDCTDLGWKHE